MTRISRWTRRTAGILTMIPPLALAACDKPTAMGDASEILVSADPELWTAIQEDVSTALQPTTFTVRDESVFDIAYGDPEDPGWSNLRLNRQLLLIGDLQNPAVAEAVDAYDGEVPEPPAIIQSESVWARNQLVTVALLPEGADPQAARNILPQVGTTYLRQFEEYARQRMFVTGPNEELTEALRDTAGFELTLPQVYRHRAPEPGVHIFRNDQPDPSRLIRNITVASRPAGEVSMTPEAAVEWRAELAREHTVPPQVTEPRPELQTTVDAGMNALQVQGVWSNPPEEWPAAGMYIARLVECADRTFLIDAWLYAPGVPKYEYVYQLMTILDGFGCVGTA